jgi:flagellar biosynthesis protein FlhA
LARQISEQNSTDDNFIPLVTLSTEWEQVFAESIIENGEERQLSMAPSQLQSFINNVRTVMDDYSEKGESPVMLTSPAIRPFVRSIVERFRPETEIMSQNEIHPKAKIKTLGQI